MKFILFHGMMWRGDLSENVHRSKWNCVRALKITQGIIILINVISFVHALFDGISTNLSVVSRYNCLLCGRLMDIKPKIWYLSTLHAVKVKFN